VIVAERHNERLSSITQGRSQMERSDVSAIYLEFLDSIASKRHHWVAVKLRALGTA
jgi:hypothetical protein